MLAVVVEGLSRAGHRVTTSVSTQLSTEVVANWQSIGVNVHVDAAARGRPEDKLQSVLGQWARVAGASECALLIAPEIDGVLETAIGTVGEQTRVINCTNPMLGVASDKWRTAIALSAAGIPHPRTCLLSDYDAASTSDSCVTSRHIAKRRDGAGCDSTRILESAEAVMAFKRTCDDPALWIVQPFLNGDSFSLSCFAGPTGVAWMKPVRQIVNVVSEGPSAAWSPELAGGTGLEYIGAVVDVYLPDLTAAFRWCEGAIAALGDGGLGWMGVDMLYDSNQRQWLVVEVNPRCTSSVLELSRAHDSDLNDNTCLLGQLWGHCILGRPVAPVGAVARAISF